MASGLFITILGILITAFLYLIILFLFNRNNNPPPFFKLQWTSFIIDEEGRYSLSRLQIFLWIFFILAQQIAALIAVDHNPALRIADHYTIVFSEPVLFLVTISFVNYISIKGIAINRINRGLYQRSKNRMVSDIISGPNGLDFSKFQMLVWTLIGLAVFEMKSVEYTGELMKIKNDPRIIDQYLPYSEDVVSKAFSDREYAVQDTLVVDTSHVHTIADTASSGISGPGYSKNVIRLDKNLSGSKLPSLSWSFLILMGLASGSYVGKKLVQTSEQYVEQSNAAFLKEYDGLNSDLQVYEEKLEASKKDKDQKKIREYEKKISEIRKSLDRLRASA